MARGPAIAHTISALDRAIKKYRVAGESVALVPTMGALHDGHLDADRARPAQRRPYRGLDLRQSRRSSPRHEDFASYPRPFDADIAVLRKLSVDLVWAPTPGR